MATTVTSTLTETWTATSTTTTLTSTTTQLIASISLVIKNVEYATLAADPELLAKFEGAIKRSVAAEISDDINPADMVVELSAGSVAARCAAVLPTASAAAAARAALDAPKDFAARLSTRLAAEGGEGGAGGDAATGPLDVEVARGEVQATAGASLASIAGGGEASGDFPTSSVVMAGAAAAAVALAVLGSLCRATQGGGSGDASKSLERDLLSARGGSARSHGSAGGRGAAEMPPGFWEDDDDLPLEFLGLDNAALTPPPGSSRSAAASSGGGGRQGRGAAAGVDLDAVLGNLEGAEEVIYGEAFMQFAGDDLVLPRGDDGLREFLVSHTALGLADLERVLTEEVVTLEGFLRALRENAAEDNEVIDCFFSLSSEDGESVDPAECRRGLKALAQSIGIYHLSDAMWERVFGVAIVGGAQQSISMEQWVVSCQLLFRIFRLIDFADLGPSLQAPGHHGSSAGSNNDVFF